MRQSSLLILSIKLFLVGNIFLSHVNSEQSTVFVVETSNSDSHSSHDGGSSSSSSLPAIKLKSLDDEQNTRIITDSESHASQSSPTAALINKKPSSAKSQQSEHQTNNSGHYQSDESQNQPTASNSARKNQNVEYVEPSSSHSHDDDQNHHSSSSSSSNLTSNDRHKSPSSSLPNDRESSSQTQADEGRLRESSDARRIDEESQVAPSTKPDPVTRSVNGTQNNSQQQVSSQMRARSTTTTPSSTNHNQDQNHHEANQDQANSHQTRPKTEERLLISITSDEEEDTSYKPHKNNGGTYQDDSGHQTHQSQQGPKRKPAITISIQDANIGKQIGGSGSSPAVIVRPGEDGSSIVIATVSNSNSNINNNNKFNNQRPPQIGSTSSLGGTSNHLPSGGQSINEPPYRDPVNNPIQNIINQHNRPTSTTRRPSGNDYGSNQQQQPTSRPITSPPYNEPYRPPPASNDPYRPPPTSNEPYRPSTVSNERPQRPTNYEEPQGNSGPYDNRPISPSSRPTGRPTVNQDLGTGYGGGGNGQQDGYESQGSGNNRPTHDDIGSSSSVLASNNEPKYPLNEKNCGLVHETRIVGGEEADPDDFLWMAAIIKSKPKEGEARPFCGGSLITRRHILTAAHCLDGLAPRDVLIRLGSYDFDDSTASSLSLDFAIDQFRVPAQYSKKTHVADVAIMRLKTPLSTSDNYKTVCMPQPRRSYVGALGTVTGYGSQSQTFRRAAPKLRQVTVPIWENRKCSVVYKRNLTESFLCAGYEEGGKDACQGDSGGPLMTEGPNERMVIVGVVSHGIGCGSPGYPGVYTRTSTYLDWIEKNTQE